MKDTGGEAFPVPMVPCDNQGGFTEVRCAGMTLLDWFAGQTLQSVYAQRGMCQYDAIANECYDMAEAMIAEKRRRETDK